MVDHDYSEHVEKPDPASVIGLIDELVKELRQERGQVALLELQLKKAQDRTRDIEEQKIPELMESIGWAEGSKLVTPMGAQITLKRAIHASIYATCREQVFNWLDDHGHGGMIKRKVIVPFGRDDEDTVDKLVEKLGSEYSNVSQEKKVEPATFSAWVRARLEAGEEMPPDNMICVEDHKIAKVT